MSVSGVLQPRTYWLTRDVLTTGVIRRVECLPALDNWRYVYEVGQSDRDSYCVGSDVHATREAAVAYAEQMRTTRIETLRRQIAVVEALSFDSPT